jgi:hypothetical protein
LEEISYECILNVSVEVEILREKPSGDENYQPKYNVFAFPTYQWSAIYWYMHKSRFAASQFLDSYLLHLQCKFDISRLALVTLQFSLFINF